MRTMRLLIAGTLTLSVIGAMSGVVAASSSEEEPETAPRPATHVTGTRTFTELIEGPTEGTGNDADAGYEWQADYRLEMSDPRVSGTLTMLGDYLEMHDAGPRDSDAGQGSVRLENDGGAWSGTWSRSAHPPCGVHTYVWLEGEGAYEGLTFWTMQCSHEQESTGEVTIEGVLF